MRFVAGPLPAGSGRRRRAAALLGLFLVGLLGAGCGGQGGVLAGTRFASGRSALSGYLGVERDAVVFVQWIPDGDGGVSGAVSLVALAAGGGGPSTLRRASAAFAGAVSGGGDVVLSFPQGRGLAATWSGRLEGESLTLGYPGADGRRVAFALHPGDSAGYRAAVAALEQEAAAGGVARRME